MSLIQPLPPDDDEGLPSYRQKPRPVGFEIAYKLDGDVLVIDSTRRVDRLNLAAVEQVRFTFKPGNLAATGYQTQIRMRDGKTVTIGDSSWRSMIEIERGGDRYVRFISALCAAIVQKSPDARFVAGKPRFIWIIYTLVVAVALCAMLFFIWRGLTVEGGNAIWIGLFIFSVAVWQMIPQVWLNRPMTLQPGTVPAHLMPKSA